MRLKKKRWEIAITEFYENWYGLLTENTLAGGWGGHYGRR